jgi:hypothetical protein
VKFESFYWRAAEVQPADHALLEQLEDQRLSAAQRKAALIRLLASDSEAARGIALDFYCLSNADLRHGPEPIIDNDVEDAVRRTALSELGRPPYVCPEPNARPKRGANHASALAALANNADPGDAPLVARALRDNDDELVILEGVRAAETVLHGEAGHPDLVSVLLEIARATNRDATIRAHAITALGYTAGEAAMPWLIEALAAPELAVSAAAARALLERDLKRNRALVASVASAWRTGEFPPFDVHEVRRILDEPAVEAAGVRITLTDAAWGLQLDPVPPFEALAYVANDWIYGQFPDLLERVERGEDAIGAHGGVTRPAAEEIANDTALLWRNATGTDVGDDPVLIRSEMTPRKLLLPRRALIDILRAVTQARAAPRR